MKRVRVVAILVWLLGTSSALVCAAPIVIPAGADQFGTDPSGTFTDIVLPAGFFGAGSQGFAGSIQFEGFGGQAPSPGITLDFDIVLQGIANPWEVTNPFVPCPTFGSCLHQAPNHQHQFGVAFPPDTSVQRLSTVTLQDIGSTAATPIEITLLSLRSVSPLQIDFGGGLVLPVDVFANLREGPQQQGIMTLIRTSENGGTWNSTLPINGELAFQIVPEPATLLLIGAGLAGIATRVRKMTRS